MRSRPALSTDSQCRLTLWVLVLLLGTCTASAETRIALIIGNSNYVNANLRLTNPANDAAAMELALKNSGFKVIVKLNARRLDFYHAVDEFAAMILRDPHSVGLFYYAGHGVQADGVNYLIPVDAEIQSSADLEANAFDIARVLRAMQAAQNEMNIVILDACRDNPLRRTRSTARGLARLDAPSGTFIAYAAAPGQTADEGSSGANGVFTSELLKAMALPSLPLEQMFKKVITGVRGATRGAQTPWFEASIQGDFYFHPTNPQALPVNMSASPPHQAAATRPVAQVAAVPAAPTGFVAQPGGAQGAAHASSAALPQSAMVRPATVSNKKDTKCESILERVQLGDSLDDQDRTYVKEKCN
jgi:uncharacterized caspase-like protein